MAATPYDAVLIVAFGGPEGPADVMPFLDNVLRGRDVPEERKLQVAQHYLRFGGVSPINSQLRALIAALVNQLNAHGPRLPVYWGNRNWHPMLADVMRQMADDGVRRALGLFTSPFSSYSSCRQYLENIDEARGEVGPQAPAIDKIRAYYNHPGFVGAMAERVRSALSQLPSDAAASTALVYTAHSVPRAMADQCRYEAQLNEACRLTTELIGRRAWRLVFQSRSGPPSQPWLEPDVSDALRTLRAEGVENIVLAPIGFISDHMEVVYDLDVEARALADELGLNMIRAGTVGCHTEFVTALRQLILERCVESPDRLALGADGPSHDVCPDDCCLRTLNA